MAEHIPEEAKNFKLVGHDSSAAWGGGSIVEYNKGFVYVGAVGKSSYNGPEGFTVHDVRDPKNPKKVAEVKAPPGVHCHKLRVVDGDILYVNSERLSGEDGRNARTGLFIFDISNGGEPKQIGFYDTPGNGPHRFGVDNKRKLAFLPNNAPGWKKRVIWTLDIKNPEKPEVVGIWGLPWMREDASTGAEEAGHPADDTTTLHGPPVIRGNRMYCAWWGGGISVIDCSDLADMKLVGHLAWAPPFPGSNHTCWPIGDKPYLVVTDEARARQKYWDAQFMWIIDARKEDRLTPVATFMPDRDKYFDRPGRYGAHNILEREIASDGPWKDIVFLTYFNAGLRAVNVGDPLHPKEVGCYVPALENDRPAVQSNDIGTDDRGLLYLIDRAGAGMHILEYTG